MHVKAKDSIVKVAIYPGASWDDPDVHLDEGGIYFAIHGSSLNEDERRTLKEIAAHMNSLNERVIEYLDTYEGPLNYRQRMNLEGKVRRERQESSAH